METGEIQSFGDPSPNEIRPPIRSASGRRINEAMIKAVLFDYDGVLTTDKTGSYSICKYVSSAANIDYELFSNEYRKYSEDLLIGRITHEEIWKDLCESIGREITIRYLFDSFKNTPINLKMFELVRNIKKNYKTGLITDNQNDRIDAVTRLQKLNELFDAIEVSAKIGSGKDGDEIFVRTVKDLNVQCSECVFIDNQEKNLLVPRKLGMSVILFDQKENDIKELVGNLKKMDIKV
jgi:putative hydrolase of the HAD superfamily